MRVGKVHIETGARGDSAMVGEFDPPISGQRPAHVGRQLASSRESPLVTECMSRSDSCTSTAKRVVHSTTVTSYVQ